MVVMFILPGFEKLLFFEVHVDIYRQLIKCIHYVRKFCSVEKTCNVPYRNKNKNSTLYDNFETVKVTTKVARKDKDGKRVKQIVDKETGLYQLFRCTTD